MRALAFFALLVLAFVVFVVCLIASFLMPSPQTGFPVFLLGLVLSVVIVREAERVW